MDITIAPAVSTLYAVNAIRDDRRLRTADKVLAWTIASHATDRSPQPLTLRQLAREAGCSTATARKAIRRLVTLGVIPQEID